MKSSRIPSPARSQGSRTPRKYKSRRTLSVCSNTSTRLTAVIEDNIGSFVLSPVANRRSILTDNTDIEEPKRRSWWKNLGENSRDVMEVLEDNNIVEPNNIIEELDMEVLSQEKKNYNVDIPESSGSESIDSIVIPQRKLFTEKEKHQQKNFDKVMGNRETLTKLHKPNTTNVDETLPAKTKDLFQLNKPRSRPIFPSALLNMSLDKTTADKTKEIIVEPKVRNIFGKQPTSKRKNMFANFIVSESEDDISDIQPKVFGFTKKQETKKRGSSRGIRDTSPTSNISNNEMDEWKMLPSSTMVEHQLEAMMTDGTPSKKRAKLSNFEQNIDCLIEGEERHEFTLVYEDENQDDVNDIVEKADETVVNISNKQNKSLTDKVNRSKEINKADEEKFLEAHTALEVHETNENNDKSVQQNTQIATNLGVCKATDEHYEIQDQNKSLTHKVEEKQSDVNKAKLNKSKNKSKVLEKSQPDQEDKETTKPNESEAHITTEQDDEFSGKINRSKIVDKVQQIVNETPDSQNYENNESGNEQVVNNKSQEGLDNYEQNKSDDEEVNKSQEVDESRQEENNDESGIQDEEVEKSQEVNNCLEQSENNEQNVSEEVEESQNIENDEENESENVNDQEEVNETGVNESQVAEISQNNDSDNEQNSDNDANESMEVQEEINEAEVVESQETEISQNNDSDSEQNNSNNESMEVNESHESDNEAIDSNNEDNEQISEAEEVNQTEVEENSMQESESDNEIEHSDNDDQNVSEVEQAENEENEEEFDNQHNTEEINEASHDTNDGIASPNISHDTTGRNRNKNGSPEVILHDVTNDNYSFQVDHNTSAKRKTSIIKDLNIKPLLAPARDSIGFSDGTKNSSAEGSGWDSHRTTRKTLRQTFGKDFTPRKSLRAMVMEQSAKRQTMKDIASAKLPIANSTELQDVSNYHDDYIPEQQESNHEISIRTRQTTLENYLQKIKNNNLERKAKMEEAVRNSLKTRPQELNPFKVPARPLFPARRQLKNPKSKPKSKPELQLDDLPEEMIDDINYKPPKRFRPSNAPWITKRLYKFLETKLEPKYDYKARVRAEKLVETIYQFAKDLRRHNVASVDAVDVLKHEMARLQIVKTHYEFYEFFHQYMPREIIVKVVPDVTNKLPVPRQGVFTDILRENNTQG